MDMNYNFIIRNRPRKNGKPNYQLILSYRSKDGTWKQASKGGYALRSLAASDKEKEKLLAKVRKTGDIDTVFEGMTLREFGEMYISSRTTLAPNSIFTYRHHLSSMAALLDKPMVDITYADVSRMINGMRTATSSIKTCVTLLKTIFREAVRYHVVTASPISDFVYKPREDKAGKPKLRTLSQMEIRTLLRSAHDHNREAWIVLCLVVYTGARIGEILALTRSDIDLSNRTITINKQLTVTDPSNHKVRGIARVKSKHSNRTVPIPPTLVAALNEYLKERVLYVHRRLTHYRTSHNINCLINRYVPGHSVHDLRHTYATRLLAEGIDIKTVASLLGDNVATVELIYVHYTDEMREKAAEDINRIFG